MAIQIKYTPMTEDEVEKRIYKIACDIMAQHVLTTRRFGYLMASFAVLLFIALFVQDFFILHLLHSQ
jgi:hypothetical protein